MPTQQEVLAYVNSLAASLGEPPYRGFIADNCTLGEYRDALWEIEAQLESRYRNDAVGSGDPAYGE